MIHFACQLQGLPPGWGAGLTETGKLYYIDGNTKTITWKKPHYSEIMSTFTFIPQMVSISVHC